MRDLKFWFYLAHFDPDFLEGKIALADGTVIDLTDLVEKRTEWEILSEEKDSRGGLQPYCRRDI